jgi:hypothetical protein
MSAEDTPTEPIDMVAYLSSEATHPNRGDDTLDDSVPAAFEARA